MTFEDLESFLTEGMMMITFRHANVMSLVGAVFEEGDRPLVVLPYMENGDLCTLIRRDDVVSVLLNHQNISHLQNESRGASQVPFMKVLQPVTLLNHSVTVMVCGYCGRFFIQ